MTKDHPHPDTSMAPIVRAGAPGPVDVERLVAAHGRTFAREAGIDLADEPGPLWQLLVLAQLLSTRISSDVAVATARELFAAGWTTPATLRASTWNARVAALGRGGYRRYDFSTATRLGENATHLQQRWGDDLRALRDEAGGDPAVCARALRTFTGIGPTGAAIFLREVQGVWPSLGVVVDERALAGARAAGLPDESAALAALAPGGDVVSLAAALVRVGRKPALLDAL